MLPFRLRLRRPGAGRVGWGQAVARCKLRKRLAREWRDAVWPSNGPAEFSATSLPSVRCRGRFGVLSPKLSCRTRMIVTTRAGRGRSVSRRPPPTAATCNSLTPSGQPFGLAQRADLLRCIRRTANEHGWTDIKAEHHDHEKRAVAPVKSGRCALAPSRACSLESFSGRRKSVGLVYTFTTPF